MDILKKFSLPEFLLSVLSESSEVSVPKNKEQLISMIFKDENQNSLEVSYEVDGKEIVEATVVKCKNGVVVNYTDDYMRRRDPDCLIVADKNDTDKPRYDDVYDADFSPLREAAFEWLKNQELILMPFMAGGLTYGYEAVLVAPKNAAFFACALGDLQYLVNIDEYEGTFKPKAIIYLVPPFRHTFFDGKQIVAHNRLPDIHEVFSFNLYPGPSAKKGIYGVLLNIGESEGWVTVHAATVKVITPYENEIVIMHEGASGGGKSEMIENIHKEPDGKIVIGQNLYTKEKFYMNLEETCELRPITDDMALCPPALQVGNPKLVATDAEEGWFLRLDNIKSYGTEPFY